MEYEMGRSQTHPLVRGEDEGAATGGTGWRIGGQIVGGTAFDVGAGAVDKSGVVHAGSATKGRRVKGDAVVGETRSIVKVVAGVAGKAVLAGAEGAVGERRPREAGVDKEGEAGVAVIAGVQGLVDAVGNGGKASVLAQDEPVEASDADAIRVEGAVGDDSGACIAGKEIARSAAGADRATLNVAVPDWCPADVVEEGEGVGASQADASLLNDAVADSLVALSGVEEIVGLTGDAVKIEVALAVGSGREAETALVVQDVVEDAGVAHVALLAGAEGNVTEALAEVENVICVADHTVGANIADAARDEGDAGRPGLSVAALALDALVTLLDGTEGDGRVADVEGQNEIGFAEDAVRAEVGDAVLNGREASVVLKDQTREASITKVKELGGAVGDDRVTSAASGVVEVSEEGVTGIAVEASEAAVELTVGNCGLADIVEKNKALDALGADVDGLNVTPGDNSVADTESEDETGFALVATGQVVSKAVRSSWDARV